MNRILRATIVAFTLVGSLGSIGCMNSCRPGVEARYNNLVDPCWPERYNYQARESVLYPFEQQATNGHIMDQTIWNYHFEPGSAKLNAQGREKLDYLTRRRGCPDGKMYLQTAGDIAFDPKMPDKLPGERIKLDSDRAQSVLAYANAQPAGTRMSFEIQPIDARDPGINSQGPATSVRGLPGQYASTLTGAVGSGLTGTGGGQAPGTPTGGGGGAQNSGGGQQQGTGSSGAGTGATTR